VQLVESELVTVVNGVAFPVVEAVPCLLRESYTRHQGDASLTPNRRNCDDLLNS
jgi:uncharacterized protein YbaR (Trm112 family)